jgi:rRNA maturation protein Nop10
METAFDLLWTAFGYSNCARHTSIYESEVERHSFLTLALHEGERSSLRHCHGKCPRYPLSRALGGLQCRSGRVWKISQPPRFDPRSVQPAASRYTDWAVPFRKVALGTHWMGRCVGPRFCLDLLPVWQPSRGSPVATHRLLKAPFSYLSSTKS